MKPFNAVVLATLAVRARVNAQEFITNCTWQTAMLVDSFLGSYCHNDNWTVFSYDWSWFDISNCLTNNGGQLIPYDSGKYWQTCKGCYIMASNVSFMLTCACLQPGLSLANATYDLNQIIWNHNGYLGCFDHYGNKSERGPF